MKAIASVTLICLKDILICLIFKCLIHLLKSLKSVRNSHSFLRILSCIPHGGPEIRNTANSPEFDVAQIPIDCGPLNSGVFYSGILSCRNKKRRNIMAGFSIHPCMFGRLGSAPATELKFGLEFCDYAISVCAFLDPVHE